MAIWDRLRKPKKEDVEKLYMDGLEVQDNFNILQEGEISASGEYYDLSGRVLIHPSLQFHGALDQATVKYKTEILVEKETEFEGFNFDLAEAGYKEFEDELNGEAAEVDRIKKIRLKAFHYLSEPHKDMSISDRQAVYTQALDQLSEYGVEITYTTTPAGAVEMLETVLEKVSGLPIKGVDDLTQLVTDALGKTKYLSAGHVYEGPISNEVGGAIRGNE